MLESVWATVTTIGDFVMDNLVVINILLSLIIIFFQRRNPREFDS